MFMISWYSAREMETKRILYLTEKQVLTFYGDLLQDDNVSFPIVARMLEIETKHVIKKGAKNE